MSLAKKGILVVVSGFSGAGKGTIMKKLMSTYGDSYALSVSATTRNPRPGEENGRDYFFVSTEQFEAMIKEEKLIEYARYVDNYYGTPRDYVEKQLEAGKSVILEIEIQGALKVKNRFPDTRLLFVAAPDAGELRSRLTGRGTESTDVIEARLSRAYEESLGIENYDYLVINDNLEECVEHMHTILENECNGCASQNSMDRVSANIDFIKKMRNELLSFSKGE